MPLKSILVALLLPPVSLLYVCAAGLLLLRWYRRAGMVLLGGGLAALLALAMPLSGGVLQAALERHLPLVPPPGDPPRAIVILSGDQGHGDGDDGLQSPGPLSLERLRRGAALQRRTGLPVLVSGGTMHPGEETLAAVLSRSLDEDFHVPVRWQETASRDTWENAVGSAAMLRADGIGSVYLVTQGWHMRRAILAFAACGIRVTAAPVRLNPLRTRSAYDLLPTLRGLVSSYDGLHEWIGIAVYTLRALGGCRPAGGDGALR